MARKIRY